jgi:hypothetical protein
MAGILVMGVALGLQEGGKKIKEKRDERKAKKAALVSFPRIGLPHTSLLTTVIDSGSIRACRVVLVKRSAWPSNPRRI